MPGVKSKRTLYRTRTVRSVMHTVQPIISKHLIDFKADEGEISQKRSISGRSRISYRSIETVLDRIIGKLRRNCKPQDILLMITPASRHPKLYKLHVIQRRHGIHLGMTTITHKEFSRLRSSKAFQKYCIVFGSRYMDLKTVVLQTKTIKSLINTLNKECCGVGKASLETKLKPPTNSKSNTSSAGDYFNNQTTTEDIKYQDSFIQTDPEVADNVRFTVSDIVTLIETINQTLEPSKQDIDRFFFMAEKLKFTLVIRPEMLWKTSPRLSTQKSKQEGGGPMTYQVESYLPGNCYLGSISLLEDDLLNELDLYPNLLLHTHVIQDVYEIIPLPRLIVVVLREVLTFLKLELFYDALGEFLFDWFKNSTFL